ncbi:MAG: hypothetical protein V4726_19450 [Verrucomicrobiota bacterium]
MNAISVNEALDLRALRNGDCFEVEGLLTYDFENISLNHCPKAERRSDAYTSSIWIDTEGAFSFDESVMAKWNGKRVVVLGFFEIAEPSQVDGWTNGFGHFGLWQARIKARRIDLLKQRRKDHSEIPAG